MPVPMAARSKACTVFGHSNTGILGSNPTQGMDVCPRFSVLVFSCIGRGLALAYHPSKNSYQLSKYIHKFQKISSKLEQSKRPNP
jgi:hypothetical protein